MIPTSVLEPPCPDAAEVSDGPAPRQRERRLHVERRPVASISSDEWQRLVAANPWSTPFSAYPFQRAWWDAYGENATDETVVVVEDGDRQAPIAILPLMLRSEDEPADTTRRTTLRHGHESDLTAVAGSAAALFMGASYHADYATLLAAPADMAASSRAIVDYLADGSAAPGWDVVDLRRLRCGDPAADELAAAFGAREIEHNWTLNLEREDVCPVAPVPAGADFDGFLETLRAKDRHEIRRKIRRAEAVGELRFESSREPLAELDTFIDLHQARWGAEGLFPSTPGGDQSRHFLRRLFELSGPGAGVGLLFVSVAGRRVAAGVHFLSRDAILYYNAGVDPAAMELSPGVLLVAAYVRLAIGAGCQRLDFLRGDERYKYQWGAVDEPIRRLLVRRIVGAT